MMQRILRRLIGFNCSHKEISAVASAHDESRPDDFLIDLSIAAIQKARNIDLSDLVERAKGSGYECLNTWPGNQYRLLAGIVEVLQPKKIVEIGTAEGVSCMAMKRTLPKGASISTFDVHPAGEWITDKEGVFEFIADLSKPEIATGYAPLLKNADMIFIDAGKDGKMEYRLLENFERIGLKDGVLLVFDDIKVWNMLRFWRMIRYPKLDLTSFGQWSGTGLVHWKKQRWSEDWKDKAKTCKYMRKDYSYCALMKHSLENGYAIRHHCGNCKKYEKVQK